MRVSAACCRAWSRPCRRCPERVSAPCCGPGAFEGSLIRHSRECGDPVFLRPRRSQPGSRPRLRKGRPIGGRWHWLMRRAFCFSRASEPRVAGRVLSKKHVVVIPAEAGIQCSCVLAAAASWVWAPAFAGATNQGPLDAASTGFHAAPPRRRSNTINHVRFRFFRGGRLRWQAGTGGTHSRPTLLGSKRRSPPRHRGVTPSPGSSDAWRPPRHVRCQRSP